MDRRPPPDTFDLIVSIIGRRYPGYEVVLPGSPSFVCKASACAAACCRSLTIAVDEGDAARLARATALPANRFLESEHGRPIELPLAQPYILGREDGGCLFLRSDESCGVYADRPLACRAYPYAVLLLEAGGGREPPVTAATLAEALERDPVERTAVPVLIRHRECPGFGGPPLTREAWEEILLTAAALQEAMEHRRA